MVNLMIIQITHQYMVSYFCLLLIQRKNVSSRKPASGSFQNCDPYYCFHHQVIYLFIYSFITGLNSQAHGVATTYVARAVVRIVKKYFRILNFWMLKFCLNLKSSCLTYHVREFILY